MPNASFTKTATLCALLCLPLLVVLLSSSVSKKPESQSKSLGSIALQPENLKAEAAIVYDPADNHILFEKNAEAQYPLASVTKLMTATVALQTLSSTSTVRISQSAIAVQGNSGLKAGSFWKLGDLIRFGLLVSSNDAMAAVAEAGGGKEFLKKMNDEAKTLGMTQSYFLDPTGLDTTGHTAGAYSSARDVALLASAFFSAHPEYFESTVRPTQYNNVTLDAKATASPLLDMPGLIGAKTGYTDLAGGNLVAVFDVSLGHPLVGVVLHSTEDGRFDDMRALIEAARSANL